jgi:hypothetical protein
MITDDRNNPGINKDRGDGQNVAYLVLSTAEIAKGYVRPLRQKYVHNTCGVVTSMNLTIAETYARQPTFYGSTFCCECAAHYPVGQFSWDGTADVVGS